MNRDTSLLFSCCPIRAYCKCLAQGNVPVSPPPGWSFCHQTWLTASLPPPKTICTAWTCSSCLLGPDKTPCLRDTFQWVLLMSKQCKILLFPCVLFLRVFAFLHLVRFCSTTECEKGVSRSSEVIYFRWYFLSAFNFLVISPLLYHMYAPVWGPHWHYARYFIARLTGCVYSSGVSNPRPGCQMRPAMK